jgi:hypothetical protein
MGLNIDASAVYVAISCVLSVVCLVIAFANSECEGDTRDLAMPRT